MRDMKKTWFIAAAFAFASVACGSSDGTAKEEAAKSDGLSIPLECRGFSFDHIQYSPGGDALPNTCAPFDAFTNNPYAVRCIDVLPGYASGYLGDEYCVLPPPPDRGTQFGVHPQGHDFWSQVWAGDLSGYADPSLTADFEVQPGG
jgi:hypothetical protein